MASEWVAYIFAKMTDGITIELASRCDIGRWMELAEKTKESFPGFDSDEHRETVLRFIDSREAVCAKRGDEIAGILLFSEKDSELCYLSVDPEARRMHIAERMLSFMLGMMDPCKDIKVITYRDGDPAGATARAFYSKMGFTRSRLLDAFGYSLEEMVLKR